MEKIVKIFDSHEEQHKADIEYWRKISGLEKLSQLEKIRQMYSEFMGYDYSRGLQRVCRVVKRERG